MTDQKLQKLRDATRIGPPREACMVWSGDRFVPFGKKEDGVVEPDILNTQLPANEVMPLYGQEKSGVKVLFGD